MKKLIFGIVPLALLAAGCASTGAAPEKAAVQGPQAADAASISDAPSCEGYVGLTYDDGPTEYTQALTDALVDHDMVATYLLVGKNIEDDPESVLHAKDNGMVLGTHTFTHVDDMTMLTRHHQYVEIQQGEDALRAVTGEEPTLWRPPHSLTDAGVELAVKYADSVQVMWTLDSEDWWAANPSMIEEHMQPVEDGDIVVLHDQDTAPDAVPGIAAILESKGLCAVGLTPEGEIDRD